MTKISAFDPNLRFLASEAAFEIDNLHVGNQSDLRPVKKLLLSICEAISDEDGSIDLDSYSKLGLLNSVNRVDGLPVLRDFFLALQKEIIV